MLSKWIHRWYLRHWIVFVYADPHWLPLVGLGLGPYVCQVDLVFITLGVMRGHRLTDEDVAATKRRVDEVDES